MDADLARGQSHLRADAATNRQALLDAAARLYSERGLDVPYEEIAREAGVGRATLYRHFPTRELMLTGIMDAMLDRFARTAAELPETPDAFFALFDEAVRIQARTSPWSSSRPRRLARPSTRAELEPGSRTCFADRCTRRSWPVSSDRASSPPTSTCCW